MSDSNKCLRALKLFHYLLLIVFSSQLLNGCGENSADYTCDPLTATTQEVVDMQNKIEARIAKKTAPFDKSIKEMAGKTAGTSGAEFQAYASAIDKLAMARANAVDALGLKEKLPSNILVADFNEIIKKNKNVFHNGSGGVEELNQEDQKSLSVILEKLKIISPESFYEVNKTLDLLSYKKRKNESIASVEQKKEILNSFPRIESRIESSAYEIPEWSLHVSYCLVNNSCDFLPVMVIQKSYRVRSRIGDPMLGGQIQVKDSLEFELSRSGLILSNFVKFLDWSKKVQDEGGANIEKSISSFTGELLQIRDDCHMQANINFLFRSSSEAGIELVVSERDFVHRDSVIRNSVSCVFKPNDVEQIIKLLKSLPNLKDKAEQALNEKIQKIEKDKDIENKLK